MAFLRLYKEFYSISHSNVSGETYTLLDPFSLTATTNIYGSTSITETPDIIHESTGKYYVTLNANYYSFDHIYEMRWHVYYLSYAPYRVLKTRFQVKPNNISGNIEIEVLSPKFDIVIGNKNIDIQI
jgi:hypothetical protein